MWRQGQNARQRVSKGLPGRPPARKRGWAAGWRRAGAEGAPAGLQEPLLRQCRPTGAAAWRSDLQVSFPDGKLERNAHSDKQPPTSSERHPWRGSAWRIFLAVTPGCMRSIFDRKHRRDVAFRSDERRPEHELHGCASPEFPPKECRCGPQSNCLPVHHPSRKRRSLLDR